MGMNTEQAPHTQIDRDGVPPIDEAARARQARREERLGDLRKVRRCTGLAIEHIAHYIAGHASWEQADPSVKLRDLTNALGRLDKEVRQIVALEERIDEDAETRAARIAEEKAKREAEARAEQRRLEMKPQEDKEELIRRAVKLAHRDAYPGLTRIEREDLLGDLFEDYEEFGDLSGPPVRIVADFCAVFAQDPEADLTNIPDFAEDYGDETDPDEQQKIRWRSWAQNCLDHIARIEAAVENPGGPPPETAAQPQGPPAAA
jgi:hypothetical protein